jgi:hypothetical protein
MKTTQSNIAGRVQDILRRVIGKIGQGREGHYSAAFTDQCGQVVIYGPTAKVKMALIALGGEVETMADRRIVPDSGPDIAVPVVIRRYRAADGRLLCDARFSDDGYGNATLWYYTTDPRNAAIITDLD